MTTRVIRTNRILTESCVVGLPAGGRGEATPEESARERERMALVRLAEMQKRWEEREAAMEAEIAAARGEAERPVKDIVERFTSMITDFVTQQRELVRSSEETVVRLAVAMARRIVGDAIAVDEDTVLGTVRRALGHVVEKEQVVVRVHPGDLRVVREHGSEWLAALEGTRSLEIQEDERIARGGCLVETEAGNVEGQIEKQLQTLERALVEAVR